MPDRHGPLRDFAGAVNGVPGSGAAIIVPLSDLGIDRVSLPFLEGQPTVGSDDASVLLPEAARDGGEVGSEQMMAFVPGWRSDDLGDTYQGERAGALVSGREFLPEWTYSPEEAYFPLSGLFAQNLSVDGLETDDLQVFMSNAHAWPKEYDIESLPEGTERIQPGDIIDTQGSTLFAGPVATPNDGPSFLPEPDEYTVSSDVFDGGVALPLAGEPAGLGVLSTPSASIAGEEANPLVGMGTAELLRSDAATEVLADVLVPDRSTVEWLAGPTDDPLSVDRRGPVRATLLDTETDLEAFGGVVDGGNGPWTAVLFVARITDEDHVVAADGIARPAGTVEGGRALLEPRGDDGDAITGWRNGLVPRAGEFVAETMGRLERV